MNTTLFSWGYWGWGTSAKHFVRLVDAVEKGRGFAPPIFVDIRLRSQGRAPDFAGSAFKEIVGEERFHQMKGLGNLAITDGGEMRIAKPEDAITLLGIAREAAKSRRRVIFYCACEECVQYRFCHRHVVADLVLKAAKKSPGTCSVQEWPGGEVKKGFVEIPVADGCLKRASGGKAVAFLPLRDRSLPVTLGALPWCTPARLLDGESEHLALVGPPRMVRERWSIAHMVALQPEHRTVADSLDFAQYCRREEYELP